jgi:FkbM family methyltransferase
MLSGVPMCSVSLCHDSVMNFRAQFLRPLKRAAVRTVYRNTTEYPLRVDGKRVVFSTVGPAANFFFSAQLAFGRVPERPVTSLMLDDLRKARCFVDVGANLGYYSCLARAFMPEGEIHAFEMDRDNSELLKLNLSLNPSEVTAVTNQVAVTAEPGEVSYEHVSGVSSPVLSLYRHPDEALESFGVERDGTVTTMTVPAVTLDDYFADRTSRPDLVKIDVEGAEYDVLRGMAGLLPQIDRMYVEIHPKMLVSAGHDAADVLKLLGEHFRMFAIPGHRTQVKQASLEELNESTVLTTNTMVLATNRSA